MGSRGMSVTESEILSCEIFFKKFRKNSAHMLGVVCPSTFDTSTPLLMSTEYFNHCIRINKKASEIIRSFLFVKSNIQVYCFANSKGFSTFFIVVYFLPFAFFFGAGLLAAFLAGLATFFATTFFVAFFAAFFGLAEEALLLNFDPLAGLAFLLAVALVLSGLFPFAEETDLSVFFDDGGLIFNFFFDD
jgi:hypothetical protein